ncbi:MAG: AI-2E family transporter [Myxococcales bacterium]
MEEPARPDVQVTHSRGTLAFFAVVLLFALYWFGYLLWDFVTDMVLGFLIAGGCRTYYLRLVRRLSGNQALAGAVVTVAVAVVIALPTLWLVTSLSRQAAHAYEAVSASLGDPTVQEALRGEGWVGRHAQQFGNLVGLEYTPEAFRKSSAAAAGAVAGFLSEQLNGVVANVFSALYHFALMLVVVFFGLVDGPAIKRRVFDLSPLPDTEEERIVRTFRNVGGAILLGNGVGSVLQGGLGALAMLTVGLPSPLFWGAVMTVFAFLPLLGIHAVSLPATLYLLMKGRVPLAIGFFVFCLVESVLIENLVKPRLMGSRMQMHSMLIFFAVLGGIASFGLVGLLYGPLIAAFFLTVIDLYERSYREQFFGPTRGPAAITVMTGPPAASSPRKGAAGRSDETTAEQNP